MPGSGLGLAIVRQVVDRHGGQIDGRRGAAGGARLMAAVPGVPAPYAGSGPLPARLRPVATKQ